MDGRHLRRGAPRMALSAHKESESQKGVQERTVEQGTHRGLRQQHTHMGERHSVRQPVGRQDSERHHSTAGARHRQQGGRGQDRGMARHTHMHGGRGEISHARRPHPASQLHRQHPVATGGEGWLEAAVGRQDNQRMARSQTRRIPRQRMEDRGRSAQGAGCRRWRVVKRR